jgi:hypothetical protein
MMMKDGEKVKLRLKNWKRGLGCVPEWRGRPWAA